MRKRKKYFDELLDVLQLIAHDKKLSKEFFIDLLTPAEYRGLGKRWQIVKQLAKKVPQRKVAMNLGVSIATVTRGSRELLNKQGGFWQALEKLSKK